MSALEILAAVAFALAAGPAALFLVNLRRYRTPPAPEPGTPAAKVSVLIPARDEEANIEAAVRSALAKDDVELECVVLDDGSTDRTPEIVRALAREDARVRLESAPPLPPGYNGKQHACAVLAERARHDVLVFIDADVRLAPGSLARMARFLDDSGAGLVSGIPREETGSFGERLIIPLIHFALLAFLPMGRMRRSTHPSYGSGIGQLFVARRDAYEAAGGHRAIAASRHDGLDLPRAFRRAGLATDLFDATELVSCRMYHSSRETWQGFLKNADQALATPKAIVPITAVLFGGQVLPLLLLAAAPLLSPLALALALAGTLAAYLPRALSTRRFHQPWRSTLLHPLGVTAFLGIQWHALGRKLLGKRASWKGRSYSMDAEPVTAEG